MKSNKGVTLTDVIIAMVLLCIFVGVVGSLFYRIIYYNYFIKCNAYATYYAIKVAEDIDKMQYNDVDNSLAQTLTERYDIPEQFLLNIQVQNYNELEGNEGKEDLLKIAKITVSYTCIDKNINYEVRKLKVKE